MISVQLGAYTEGREHERAAVVAYLRGLTMDRSLYDELADAIEKGEHVPVAPEKTEDGGLKR